MKDLLQRKRPAAADVTADDIPGLDRRRSVRQASLLEVARMTIGDRSELCRLRDVSAQGLRAELYCPVNIGDRVTIELRTGHVLEGTIGWSRGGDMGVTFDAPMPITEMLSHCSFDERVTTVRAPRLDVEIEAMLMVDHFRQPAQVVNVSQSGLKLLLDDYFDADTPCTIVIPQLGQIEGEIKWWREREGGLMFTDPVPYTTFADWRRALHPHWRQNDETHRDPVAWFPPEVSEDAEESAPKQRPTRRFGQRGSRK